MNPTSLIDNHQVISFDIFDTLILRPYVKPVDVFHHIERITGLKKFARNRVLAERNARKLKNGIEVTYEEIYQQLSSKYRSAYDFELSFEKRICLRNEETYQLYQYALEKGKTVIIISDMYLDKEIIEEILTNAGYQNYDHLFLSSYHQKTKSSGDLFDLAIETLKVSPDNILHIGDNQRKDIEMANSRGIHTMFYPKVIDRFLEEHSNLYALIKENTDKRFKRDDLTISVVLGLNAILWSEDKSVDYWTRLGKIYAAPLLYFFTRWVYKSAREQKIKNIAIVARDGYNIIRIFKLFDQKNEFNPQYVYLPRYVSETSNLHTVEDLYNFFEELGETEFSLTRFIEHFSQENEEINQLWQQYNNRKGETDYDHLKKFILEHQHLFIKTSRTKRNLVLEYLNQKNLLDGDIIFVDSSTTQARAQNLIRNILLENNIAVRLLGFYYKINQRHKILDQRDIRPYRDKKYRTDKWDIMEYFMSAPERPILAVKKEGDEYLPVYQNIDDNEFEKTRIETCMLMSQGVQIFSKRAFEIFEDIPIINDLDTVVLIINNLLNNPSTKDIAKTKKLHHTINNDSTYNPIITKYRKIKHGIPNIFGQQVHVERISPEFEHFLPGSPDALITNGSDDEYLSLNVSFMDREPHLHDKANIFLIKSDGCKIFLDKTAAWNFRKGASLQYRPEHKEEILYNTHQNKKIVTARFNLKTQQKTILPLPVANLSDDGKNALCLVLPYSSVFDSHFAHKQLSKKLNQAQSLQEAGVYLMNIDSGKAQQVFSCAQILSIAKEKPGKKEELVLENLSYTNKQDWYYLELTHHKQEKKISTMEFFISRQGEFKPATNENYEEFFGYDYSSAENKRLSEANENGELQETIKQDTAILSQDQIASQSNAINSNSFSPDGKYYLTETASSRKFPYIKLFLHLANSDTKVCLGYFYSNPDYYKNNPACKNLLTPRWTPNGKSIIIESIHEGYRAIYRIDSQEAISVLDRPDKNIIHENELRSIIARELPYKPVSKLDSIKKKSKKTIIDFLQYLTGNRLFESN